METNIPPSEIVSEENDNIRRQRSGLDGDAAAEASGEEHATKQHGKKLGSQSVGGTPKNLTSLTEQIEATNGAHFVTQKRYRSVTRKRLADKMLVKC